MNLEEKEYINRFLVRKIFLFKDSNALVFDNDNNDSVDEFNVRDLIKNNTDCYDTKEKIVNKIRNDNSYIKNIDFNKKYSFNIVELILNECNDYGFKFNNNYFLRNGKYPKILSNNIQFMRYVIDKDFNNLAYIDVNIDKEVLRKIINYTFRKVYYLKGLNRAIKFDLVGVFEGKEIINNEYFKECLKYIK